MGAGENSGAPVPERWDVAENHASVVAAAVCAGIRRAITQSDFMLDPTLFYGIALIALSCVASLFA